MTVTSQPIISLADYKQNDAPCRSLFAGLLWTKYGRIHTLRHTHPDYLPSLRSRSHHHQTHASTMQYKAYAYQYYTLSVYSSPLSLRMKQQKTSTNKWKFGVYSHHLYILSLNYHEFARSRLSYPKQYKETWYANATTSLSTPPSSQHHLAGIAVVSCLLFIHTTLLVIHIAYGHFAAHHIRLVI